MAKRRLGDKFNGIYFTDDVYQINYSILFNVGENDLNRVIKILNTVWGGKPIPKSEYSSFSVKGTVGMCTCKEGEIVIQFKKGFRLTNRTLVHECAHAAVEVFTQRAIKVDASNDEPFAYYIAWLVNKVTEHGNKNRLWG